MDAVERLNRRLLLAALGLGVVAAIVAHAYLQGLTHRVAPPRTVPVVIAVQDIPAHTAVTATMVRVAQFRPSDLPAAAVTSAALAVGTITTTEVYQGQPLVRGDLSSQATPLTLSYAVPPGMRAFTLAISTTSGVAELIQPGDHVDVLAAFTGQAGGGGAATTTVDTLEQDLDVLAVGQRVAGQPGPVPAAYTTVTLAVSPGQAAILAFASSRAALSLDLRNVADSSSVGVPPENGAGIPGA